MSGTEFDGSAARSSLPPADPEFHGVIGEEFAASTADFPLPLTAPDDAPNVLLIMGDDIGYAHMSAFGGPADTPVFDRIAAEGLSYTNFHTTAVCSASRAALLTGRNSHSVGMGGCPEGAVGFPGYHAVIPRSAATVLEVLRDNGYGTAWVGKTHLTPLHEITPAGPFDRWPVGMGAEYFYGFFGPGVSQWHPPLWENTTPIQPPKTVEEGYHLEEDMADQTIKFIRRQKSIHPDKPWIAYYAPNGHKPPIGVPKEWIEKYRGRFDDGYDKLRERTLAKQKELGVVPADTQLAPWPETLPSWDEITDTDKMVGARWMEVFTAAVAHTDYQIGRIVQAIEQTGDYENTLIVYIAGDNGPTPEGGLHGAMNKLSYFNGLVEDLDDVAKQVDLFGGPESHGCNPAAWGYATSTPFTHGKMVASGGGCSTAVAFSWPNRIADAGGKRRQFHHLIDITPTILECVGLPQPAAVNGIEQMPMQGVSMRYTFDEEAAEDRHTTQYFELFGTRAIYHDGWWAGTLHGQDGVHNVAEPVPFDEDVWALYDMRSDFGLSVDLSAEHPDKLIELKELFEREAHAHNVYPMANDAFELLVADRPRLINGNRATYLPGTVRIPEEAVVNIKNRSFSLIADVVSPGDGVEGTLVTLGGETGGYAFTVVDGRPVFHYNWLGRERYTITADQALPTGDCSIRFDFAYDGGGMGKGGTGTLHINGTKVGEGRIDKTVPIYFSTDDTFDIGEDWGTPVSPSYEPPFRFNGTLRSVTIIADDNS